jgi:hypothetical protein
VDSHPLPIRLSRSMKASRLNSCAHPLFFRERRPWRKPWKAQDGAALVIVLALAAVLLVVVVSFTATSSKEASLSRQSSSYAQAEDLISVATANLVSDLGQEMKAGSVFVRDSDGNTLPVLYPATPLNAVPDRSSASRDADSQSTAPNLVKQSISGKPFYGRARAFAETPVFPQADKFPVPARVSNISTQSGDASVTPARWNKPLLLPRVAPASDTDFTPSSKGDLVQTEGAGDSPEKYGGSNSWVWTPPDWVYLSRDGRSPLSSKDSNIREIIGRYAYQVYDVGGLLDLNVAGYDPDAKVTGDAAAARRSHSGLANLREIGFTDAALKTLLAFRNPASLAEADGVPYMNRYVNYLFSASKNKGFLRVAADPKTGVSDRAFVSRAGMISFVQQLGSSPLERASLIESLQSLTHFSRSIEQPSFRPGFRDVASDPQNATFIRPSIVPPAGRVDDTLYSMDTVPNSVVAPDNLRRTFKFPYEMALGNNRGGNDAWGTVAERLPGSTDSRYLRDLINPGFLEVRVLEEFRRVDGSRAVKGEPLVKKRFPLSRLSWITRTGPSAEQPPGTALYNPEGTADAIYACFGLKWMIDPKSESKFWGYDHGNTGGIFKLEELLVSDPSTQRPREPDFFELLKASVTVGSVGKSAVASHSAGNPLSCAVYNQVRDRNSTLQIFEIGLNLIDQWDADSFPTLLRVPNRGNTDNPATDKWNPSLYELAGVEDLPYFYRLHVRAVRDASDPPVPAAGKGITEVVNLGTLTGYKCGTTCVLGIPELWNPHAKSSAAYDGPTEFRITAASERPSSIYDAYFSKCPPIGNLASLENLPWITLGNDGMATPFTFHPHGFFAFGSSTDPKDPRTYNWLGGLSNPHRNNCLTTDKSGPWNPTGQSFPWPRSILLEDTTRPSGKRIDGTAGTQPPNRDMRMRGLFWNLTDVQFFAEPRVVGDELTRTLAGSPATRMQSFLGVAMLAGFGTLNADGSFPWLPRPPGWPLRMNDMPPPTLAARHFDGAARKTVQSLLFSQSIAAMQQMQGRIDFGSLGGGYSNVQELEQIAGGTAAPAHFRGNDRIQQPEISQLTGAEFWPDPSYIFAVKRPAPSPIPPALSLPTYLVGPVTRALKDYRDPLAPPQFADTNPSNPLELYRFTKTMTTDGGLRGGSWRAIPIEYPRTFNPYQTQLAANYHVQAGAKTYQDGRRVPDPFPMYQSWAISLTGHTKVSRSIIDRKPQFWTNEASGEVTWPADPGKAVYGAGNGPGSAPLQRGMAFQSETIDLRGTELIFSLGNASLFREPTALCQPGFPAGSNLSAGGANFFSGSGYRGGVTDETGRMWVGFSFGEIPTQALVVTKPFLNVTRSRLSPWNTTETPVGEMFVPALRYRNISPTAGVQDYDANVFFPIDLYNDRLGLTEMSGGASTQAAIEINRTDASARFFLAPFNIAGIGGDGDHGQQIWMTIRLEYRDPSSPTGWSRYSERYVEVGAWNHHRDATSPVDGVGHVVPNRGQGALPTQNATGDVSWETVPKPLLWGLPFVTSYDPRTSRFGNPGRASSTDAQVILATDARRRQNLQPLPTDNNLGPHLLLPYNGSGQTDRPKDIYVAAGVASAWPEITTSKQAAPAWFNSWLCANDNNRNGSDMRRAYSLTVGREQPSEFETMFRTQWWAMARGADSKLLYQYPSPNSFDYGWFPHAYEPDLFTAGGLTRNYRKADPANGPIPNFWHDNADTEFADTVRVGLFSENVMPGEATVKDPNAPYRQAYADPDDVVRRASGARAALGGFTATEGLPLSQRPSAEKDNAQNRPIVLNRPFQSVGEMGYAFRGSPWKNIDFSTPESGDTALLDVFCISEPPPLANASLSTALDDARPSAPPLVAGKINLNTRQEPVIRALISGALKDEADNSIVVTKEESSRIARALIYRTTGLSRWLGPISNIAELVGRLFAKNLIDDPVTEGAPVYTSRIPRTTTEPERNPDIPKGETSLKWHFTGFSEDLVKPGVLSKTKDAKVPRRQEAVIRALAGAGQTRVWNLMMDVVVQSGQIPPGGRELSQFVRNAEARAWVFLAIDRFTGEVLDRQVEMVSE